MFKALGRITKDKTVFNVEIKPIDVSIFTNQAFNFKIQIIRGKQDALESKQVKVERSIRNTDVKICSFNESFNIPCTYFVNHGQPEHKLCML